jgi:50S ribosomal subunit-associated GTPase HflX
VDAILHELELDANPRLLVFNKGDLVAESPHETGAIVASARTGLGIAAIRERIGEGLAAPADQEKTRALAEP